MAPMAAGVAKITVEAKPVINTETMEDDEDLQVAIEMIEDHLSIQWKKLGRFLGVKDHQLDQLSSQKIGELASEKVRGMFNLWIQMKGSKATLEVLIKALVKIQRVDLAEKLKKTFGLDIKLQ